MTLKFANGLYCFALVFITAMITKYLADIGLSPFYDLLEKPLLTPDGKYFAYVWSAIYFLLFISFYIILSSKKSLEQLDDANALFISQLFLQIVWAFSFFYLHQIGASAIVIVLLDMVVALMLHTFLFINLWAAVILLPYFLWMMYATILNIYFYFLN